MGAPRKYPLPPLALVQALLDLDFERGLLYWTALAARGRFTGHRAGSEHGAGYRQIKIGRLGLMEHQIVWLLAHGDWAPRAIDHVDGDRRNNAPRNLRLATASENGQNRYSANAGSASGVLGVAFIAGDSRRRDRWEARITVDGRLKHLGLRKTPEEAQADYVEAKRFTHPFGNL